MLIRGIRTVLGDLHTSIPGGPGRAHPWEEADDIADRHRREREVWRQGADE
jgi:hypothetical protein